MYTYTAQAIQHTSAPLLERWEKPQHRWRLPGGPFALLQRFRLVTRYIAVSAFVVGMASAFTACSFNPGGLPIGCEPPGCPVDFNDGRWIPEEIDIIAENAALTAVEDSQRRQSPNGAESYDFQSHHGSGCADATRAAVRLPNGEDLVGIRIEDSIPLPSSKHTGTVYLNGWELEYTGDNHNVKGLGAWITKVRQENGALHWEAGGVLTDKNADDAYRWCYSYTVVMWDTDVINAYVIQDNFEHSQTFVHEYAQTAGLRVLRGEHEGPTVPWVVPRGFGLMFNGDYADHHPARVSSHNGSPISKDAVWPAAMRHLTCRYVTSYGTALALALTTPRRSSPPRL